tara:strand:- start:1939 stop:2247 length:309 start_codon:yes stop_codon:yes gene_type:complete
MVAKTKARPKMAKDAFMAKVLPMTLYPRIRKGIFTNKIKRYSGNMVISVANKEIPVAPPSINLLGKRKLSRPKAAENIPITIKKVSLKKELKLILSLRERFK